VFDDVVVDRDDLGVVGQHAGCPFLEGSVHELPHQR
jgi:hypothetical protein